MFPAPEPNDHAEPFGTPFTNREVAVIVADELNRHDRGLWFYKVEQHLEGKRWIVVRGHPGDVFLRAPARRRA